MKKIYKAKWILPSGGMIYEDYALLVDNGKIIELIPHALADNYDFEITDFAHSVITPGFINLHTHLQYTDLKKTSFKRAESFSGWIIELIKEYSKLNMEQKISSIKHGIEELILSGTSCCAQLSKEIEFLELFRESKILTYLFFEIFSLDEQSGKAEFEILKEKINLALLNKPDNIEIGISPHSIYTVHESLWKKIAQYAAENNILVHSHLGESQAEIDWLNQDNSDIDSLYDFIGWTKLCPAKKGLNPVEYLEMLGVPQILGDKLILAHLNYLDEGAFEKIIGYNSSVAHCPRSNMILSGKTINLKKNFKILSNKIGIGTDSKLSNFDLNILNEARFIKNSVNIDALDLLDMITDNSARILGLQNITGNLNKGNNADFNIFRLEKNESYKHFIDKERPDNVFIQGKQMVKDRKLLWDMV